MSFDDAATRLRKGSVTEPKADIPGRANSDEIPVSGEKRPTSENPETQFLCR